METVDLACFLLEGVALNRHFLDGSENVVNLVDLVVATDLGDLVDLVHSANLVAEVVNLVVAVDSANLVYLVFVRPAQDDWKFVVNLVDLVVAMDLGDLVDLVRSANLVVEVVNLVFEVGSVETQYPVEQVVCQLNQINREILWCGKCRY